MFVIVINCNYFSVRLTPAYMVVLLMAEVSARWLRNVSVFEPENSNHISCAKYWWRNMLYINSLYPKNEMVMINCFTSIKHYSSLYVFYSVCYGVGTCQMIRSFMF